MSDDVSFNEIASRLGVNPSTIPRIIKQAGSQLGVTVKKGRNTGRNSMWGNFLSREDADRLVAFYEAGNSGRDDSSAQDTFQTLAFST